MAAGQPQPAASEPPGALSAPCRIGVVFGDLGRVRLPALKYLVVHLNTIQTEFEFELLPKPANNPLVSMLGGKRRVAREQVREQFNGFLKQLADDFASEINGLPPGLLIDQSIPERIVLFSMGRFHDGYYTTGDSRMRVIALGDWKRELAPPSILEFFISLLLRQSIALVSATFRASGHFGSKGCKFDLTNDLDDARLKVMQGFICSDCRRRLDAERPGLAEKLLPVLNSRGWLGSPEDPTTPAGVVAKLGHDLFLTRGVRPSWWDIARNSVRDDGVKEIIKVIFLIIAAALLVLLGLKRV